MDLLKLVTKAENGIKCLMVITNFHPFTYPEIILFQSRYKKRENGITYNLLQYNLVSLLTRFPENHYYRLNTLCTSVRLR